MKKINGLMILTLLSTVGCSTQTGTSPTELQALSKQCKLGIPASQETQEIMWEAVWNEDQSQVIAFKKGERSIDRYTLANSVSVEDKEFQVLISDFDRDSLEMISNARQTFRPNANNGSSTTSNARPYRYFEVLFVENIFPQERRSVYLIEQHRTSNQQDMLNIYKAMKNEETLTQLPESQKEACFNVTAETFEDIAINVAHEGGSGWQNPQHIQDVFQNRQVYLTTTYGAWKPSEDESKRAETGLHIHLADDSNESRDPVTIAFKQLNREFNRPNAEVRYNITGLQIPRQLPVIGAVPGDLPNFISKNDLSDDMFNLLVQRKVLNPFEVIFGLSGGTGQEQMDFTVEITTNPRKIRQVNIRSSVPSPESPSDSGNSSANTSSGSVASATPSSRPVAANQNSSQQTTQAPSNPVASHAQTQQRDPSLPNTTRQTSSLTRPDNPPFFVPTLLPESFVSNNENSSVVRDGEDSVITPLQLLSSPPDSHLDVVPPTYNNSSCMDLSNMIPASPDTKFIVWRAYTDGDEIVSLDNDKDTYTLSNKVSFNTQGPRASGVSVLISDQDTNIPENQLDRIFQDTFEVLYLKNVAPTQVQFEFHQVGREDFVKIHRAIKGQETLTASDLPTTKTEACYTLTLQKMKIDSVASVRYPSPEDDSDDLKNFLQNRLAYATTFHAKWMNSGATQAIVTETALSIAFEDLSDQEHEPYHLFFKQSDDEYASFPKPIITGLRVPYFILFTDNYDDDIDFEYVKGQTTQGAFYPSHLEIGFSIYTDNPSSQDDYTIQLNL